MSESLILFDQGFFEQHDKVAMDSPLGPKLANVFLCYHEKVWLTLSKVGTLMIHSYFFA